MLVFPDEWDKIHGVTKQYEIANMHGLIDIIPKLADPCACFAC